MFTKKTVFMSYINRCTNAEMQLIILTYGRFFTNLECSIRFFMHFSKTLSNVYKKDSLYVLHK